MTWLALKFNAAEYFSLMVLGLTGAVVLAHGAPEKAVAMVLVGLLLGLVGIDVNSGAPRMTFDLAGLADGIGFVPDRHRPVRHRRTRGDARPAAGPQPCWRSSSSNLWPSRADIRACIALDPARHRHRLHPRRVARRRRGALVLRGLCGRKESIRPRRSVSAAARSKASPRRKPPTMPARRRVSFRCSRSAFPAMPSWR